ncbi:cell wall protein [Pyxidicoccus sp. 3LG]
MPKARARARRPRTSRSSPRPTPKSRAPSKKAAPAGQLTFEDALRGVFREEFSDPVSNLAARLLRIADALADASAGLPIVERVFAPPPVEEAEPPPPPACAVIGCKRPRGSLGYCILHAQRRRQMISSNRLHAEWVENAAPHSVPDVIPPRKRRGERQREERPAATAAPAAEPARPVVEPRMFVRKKAAASVLPTKKGAGLDSGSNAQASLPLTSIQDQIASTVSKWANEFKARKKPTH